MATQYNALKCYSCARGAVVAECADCGTMYCEDCCSEDCGFCSVDAENDALEDELEDSDDDFSDGEGGEK